MDSTLLSKSSAVRKRLINTYRKSTQFGLVLGAGVTVASNVPNYDELACRLLEKTAEHPQFTGSREWARDLAEFQRNQISQKRAAIPPDEIILYVHRQFENDEKSFRELVKQELYGPDVAVGMTAKRGVFENNPTLDSILRFCAARPGTVLSPGKSRYAVEPNIKIGGILTTNYDNLLESACHTKYRRPLLKPITRPSTNEFRIRGQRAIPVYHIHGYEGYRSRPGPEQEKNPKLVIAEDDYFETFYDPLGFSNYVAMNFLRRFPALFIGSRMTDKNLRRFLYHLHGQKKGGIPEHQRKFAILKLEDSPVDAFLDEILSAYGIETIWIRDFNEIPEILRELYVNSGEKESVESLSHDWENLSRDAWAKKKPG